MEDQVERRVKGRVAGEVQAQGQDEAGVEVEVQRATGEHRGRCGGRKRERLGAVVIDTTGDPTICINQNLLAIYQNSHGIFKNLSESVPALTVGT